MTSHKMKIRRELPNEELIYVFLISLFIANCESDVKLIPCKNLWFCDLLIDIIYLSNIKTFKLGIKEWKFAKFKKNYYKNIRQIQGNYYKKNEKKCKNLWFKKN